MFQSLRFKLLQQQKYLSPFLHFKPGSHERHKHKINMKTKHDFSSGTCEDKTMRIFLCFAFCSALGLCLDYAYAYAYAYDYAYAYGLWLMLM